MSAKSIRVRVFTRMISWIRSSFPVILPSLLLAYFVNSFGMNVVIHDEWIMVPLLQKSISGTLSIHDLYAQVNEHRILFPKIVMLAIERLSGFNTVPEMFLGWFLLTLSGLLILAVYQTKSSFTTGRSWLILIPASLLLFSFSQWESILWGIASCSIYMMVFAVVASFYFLEKSRGIDIWLVISVLSGILSSFSFLVGLAVWPIGLVQMLMSKEKRVLRVTLWCSFAIVTVASYFNGWVPPSYHPSVTYALVNPLGAAAYFLVLIGAPFVGFSSYYSDSSLAGMGLVAAAFGLVTALVALLVIAQAYRGRILRRNKVWLSLILFTALSSLVTTIGRSGFGWMQALTASRYIPITSLGIIGTYLLAVSVSRASPAKKRSFDFHSLLALILIGLIIANTTGWSAGQIWKGVAEMSAYTLATYGIQSDETLIRYGIRSEEGAKFLQENRMSVFSRATVELSTLKATNSSLLFALGVINGEVVPTGGSSVVIDRNRQKTVTIGGWAVDNASADAASAVFVTLDEKMDIPTLYGLDRRDVAQVYDNPRYRYSGYIATFSSELLTVGEHTLSIKIVSKDGLRYYETGVLLRLIVS